MIFPFFKSIKPGDPIVFVCIQKVVIRRKKTLITSSYDDGMTNARATTLVP